MNLSSLSVSSTLEDVFIHIYFISWAKRKRFHRSCWFLDAILVHNTGAPTWRLHTKLYKVAWNTLTNNSETMNHTDLRIGEVIYECVSYNISSFWLISLKGFDFIFVLRNSENDLYTKTNQG